MIHITLNFSYKESLNQYSYYYILQLNKKFPIYQSQQQLTMNSSRSISHDQLNKPKNMCLQHKLKKEIDNKFNKKSRKDQINHSTQNFNRKTSSLFLNNPLTKSSFSLNDAITHKGLLKDTLEPIKKAVKSMSSKKFIALSSRGRYSTFNDSIFQTKAQILYPRQQNPIKNTAPQVSKKHSLQGLSNNRANYKFKLLIKEPRLQYKSASQRKIARIDSKINQLKQKRLLLESLVPIEKAKPIVSKHQPKLYNLTDQEFKQKIIKMLNQLIKTLQLYFNMYQHANIVGGHMRNVEGYNAKIKNMLMSDEMRAKRIQKPEEVTLFFQVFQTQRTPTYMQEDMAIFNLLSNFLLKMEKRYTQTLENYNYYQNKKRKDEKEAFTKTRQKFQKKMGRHDSVNKISHFIENRLRFDQGQRQQFMSNLQKRGVVLNLVERSRELILRQRQKSVKNSLQIHSIK